MTCPLSPNSISHGDVDHRHDLSVSKQHQRGAAGVFTQHIDRPVGQRRNIGNFGVGDGKLRELGVAFQRNRAVDQDLEARGGDPLLDLNAIRGSGGCRRGCGRRAVERCDLGLGRGRKTLRA